LKGSRHEKEGSRRQEESRRRKGEKRIGLKAEIERGRENEERI
jgi:hypothetical protein